jgi:hypothetical protein
MRTIALALSLALSTAALAVPMQLTHQGSLSDSAGVPLEGAHQLTVSIFADASGGSALWTDTLDANLEGGAFSVVLGAGAAMDAGIFDGSVRYVELAVDGGAPLPQRLPLTSVPYAVRAGHAATADALSAPLDWADIANTPEDADSLADLACEAGDVPTFDGVAWGCASPTPASVDVNTLSGTIDVDNLPVGTGTGTVAAGDHTHSFGQITGELGLDRTLGDLPLTRTSGNLPIARVEGDLPLSRTTGDLPVARLSGDLPLSQTSGNLDLARTTGDLPVARLSGNLPLSQTSGTLDIGRTTGNVPVGRLPVGTAANTVAAGDHTHTAAQVGAVPATGGTVSGDLAVTGLIRVGHRDTTCNTGLEGALRWSDALQICTEGTWTTIFSATPGSSNSNPATSCNAIKQADSASADGAYWIRLQSGSVVQLYCDMTTDGGGWTLIRLSNAGNTPSLNGVAGALNTGALTNPTNTASGQIAQSDANAMGNVLMAINTAATYDTKIWWDKTRVGTAANRQISWVYDGSRPQNWSEAQSSSIYPPSQNRWGQNVGGGTHINGDGAHSLCFGDWNQGGKGHVCINRNSPDWWNYGSQAATNGNGSARVALFVK